MRIFSGGLNMAITAASKVKDILASPAAMAIVKKHMPGIDDPRTKAAAGMSLKALMAFPQSQVPKETAAACAAELEAANIE
jgi:hypothetical protein